MNSIICCDIKQANTRHLDKNNSQYQSNRYLTWLIENWCKHKCEFRNSNL